MPQQTINKYFESNPAIAHIQSGLKDNIADIVRPLALGRKLTIVSDENTHKILGEKAEKALSQLHIKSIILHEPAPDDKTVEKILSAISDSDALIAVGSGTINDICKYASYKANKPYIVLGTAPSMNGYSSANASIIVNGHKKTLKAHLPKAILLDTDILAAAPVRLIKSGLGDSLCRPTAQADWLLSHLLLGTPYNSEPFEMLAPFEQDLFANSKALVNGDRQAVELLANTLVLSGFGMYMCGGSYPASQGEHMIAHTMEMVHENLSQSYHGEQIGITTLTMAKIIENGLQKPHILSANPDEDKILRYFGKDVGGHCIEEYREKMFNPQKLDEINHKITSRWDDIAQQISDIFIPYDKLYKTLKEAAAPLVPSDIGWNSNDYSAAVSHAKYSRNRFTFLDIS